MSVVLYQNQKHRQLDENPEGKHVIFTVLIVVALAWIITAIYMGNLKRTNNADKVAILVETGFDKAGADIVAEAKNDPGVRAAALNKDGTLTLTVDNTTENKQLIAANYRRLARAKRSTTIKTVVVLSPDGDRSIPEYL